MARKVCPHCGAPAVAPRGPVDAQILIISEKPSDGDINFDAHWTGPEGKILKSELGKVGIDYRSCRICTINLHAPGKPVNPECQNLAMSVVLKQAQGKKGILLIGAECAKVFVGKPIDDIGGLRVEKDVALIRAPVIVCAQHPNTVIVKGGTVGEFRLALRRFAEAVDELEENHD